jgi:two-component system sensor histidine kinase KdpD
MPKTPEQWLEEASPQKKQGIFKLFLGYAPGVGKTYNMLSEGIRRQSRGEDVVIGLVETHGRKGVAELASKLEAVPRRVMEYKGASFDEMMSLRIPTSRVVSTPSAMKMSCSSWMQTLMSCRR